MAAAEAGLLVMTAGVSMAASVTGTGIVTGIVIDATGIVTLTVMTGAAAGEGTPVATREMTGAREEGSGSGVERRLCLMVLLYWSTALFGVVVMATSSCTYSNLPVHTRMHASSRVFKRSISFASVFAPRWPTGAKHLKCALQVGNFSYSWHIGSLRVLLLLHVDGVWCSSMSVQPLSSSTACKAVAFAVALVQVWNVASLMQGDNGLRPSRMRPLLKHLPPPPA